MISLSIERKQIQKQIQSTETGYALVILYKVCAGSLVLVYLGPQFSSTEMFSSFSS